MVFDIIRGTEFEMAFLEHLIQSSKNVSNAFEYFECGILDYAIDRSTQRELSKRALAVYHSVGTSFYSPLALNTFLENVSKTKNRAAKLSCFVRMMEDRSELFSSFFHFREKARSGIFGPSTARLSQQWTFAVVIRP